MLKNYANQLLLLFLILIIPFSGCIKEVDRPFDVSFKEKLKYIPEEISYIGYFNVSKVYETKHYGFISNLLFFNVKKDLKDIQKHFSIIIKKNVDDLLYAENMKTGKRYYLLSGNFATKLSDIENNNNKQIDLFVYHISRKLVLFTNDSLLLTKIEGNESFSNLSDSKQYLLISNSIIFKNFYWIASYNSSIAGTILDKDKEEEYKLLKLLNQLDCVGLSFDVRRDINMNLAFMCNDLLPASLLKSILKGGFAIYKLSVPNDIFITDISKIQYEEYQNKLIMKLHFSEEGIERFKKSEIINRLKINFEK